MPNRTSNVPVGALVLASVGLQLAYPLTHGAARDRITVATVVVVAGASVGHAGVTAGRRGLAACVVAAGLGFGAELVGVHTGFPFGHYAYAGSLGPKLAGVPLLAGLAWTMLAWPAGLAARRLAGSFPARLLVGAWALASWDLFLDPQMVAAGHWRWADPDPHLPGVPNVPLTNYAGWLLIASAISVVLQAILGSRVVSGDGWMLGLYLWTYVSSVVGLAGFLHLAGAALWGALGMGLVAIPLAVRVATRRPA